MQAEQEKTVSAVDLDTTIEQVRNLFNLFFQKLNLKFLIVSSSLFALYRFVFALYRFILSLRITSFCPFSSHYVVSSFLFEFYRLILFIY